MLAPVETRVTSGGAEAHEEHMWLYKHRPSDHWALVLLLSDTTVRPGKYTEHYKCIALK